MRSDRSACYTLSRRGFLIGSAGALVSAKGMPSTPSCTLLAEQEEGPYYIDDAKLRRNITEGKPGLPVKLRVALVDANRCTPLQNAALDIWHCDALGVYSGFTANSPNGRPGPPGPPPPRPGGLDGPGPPGGMPPRGARRIDETRFLRGVQLTDDRGLVEFETVYPGWYFGRAIHIHLKVHLGGSSSEARYAGGHVSHTGQLFFPEDITAEVAHLQPYARRLDVHRTLQTEDGIFNGQHGSSSMVNLSRLSSGSETDGYLATVTLAIDPNATPGPVHGFGPGRGGPPRGL
jgi:protocatechuate 3,4-dioxygenase beta subunit